MSKSKFFMSLFAALVMTGSLMLSSCASMCPAKPKAGEVEHLVLVWLKKPGNAEDRAAIIAAAKSFKSIPGVLSVSAGEVIGSERPVVDDSYDVGIAIRFSSNAALDGYEKHPDHVKAVNEILKPKLSKLTVYDFTVK